MVLFDVLNDIVDVLSSDGKKAQGVEQSKVRKPVTALEVARLKAMEEEKQKIYAYCYSAVLKYIPDIYAKNMKEYTVDCSYMSNEVKLDREVADAVMEKAVRDALKFIELDDYSLSKNNGTFASRYGGSLTISWK